MSNLPTPHTHSAPSDICCEGCGKHRRTLYNVGDVVLLCFFCVKRERAEARKAELRAYEEMANDPEYQREIERAEAEAEAAERAYAEFYAEFN